MNSIRLASLFTVAAVLPTFAVGTGHDATRPCQAQDCADPDGTSTHSFIQRRAIPSKIHVEEEQTQNGIGASPDDSMEEEEFATEGNLMNEEEFSKGRESSMAENIRKGDKHSMVQMVSGGGMAEEELANGDEDLEILKTAQATNQETSKPKLPKRDHSKATKSQIQKSMAEENTSEEVTAMGEDEIVRGPETSIIEEEFAKEGTFSTIGNKRVNNDKNSKAEQDEGKEHLGAMTAAMAAGAATPMILQPRGLGYDHRATRTLVDPHCRQGGWSQCHWISGEYNATACMNLCQGLSGCVAALGSDSGGICRLFSHYVSCTCTSSHSGAGTCWGCEPNAMYFTKMNTTATTTWWPGTRRGWTPQSTTTTWWPGTRRSWAQQPATTTWWPGTRRRWAPVPTPNPVHNGTGVFSILSGPCRLVGACVTSANYPGNYGNNQHCSIRFTGNGTVSAVDFDTEACCDSLFIGGRTYKGTHRPIRVRPRWEGDLIKWRSDFSVTARGFKLCSSDALPPPWSTTPPPWQATTAAWR